ncbi:MAG: YfiT family bacillithiol transferase [Gemmatimonadaceae bacterium]
MTDPRYPVGRFEPPATYDDAFREQSMAHLAHLPTAMRAAVAGLNDAQLDTPYRDGGWTIRQVVHHVADSHMHAYMRTKFALAEHEPAIKAYDEARWATFTDAHDLPVDVSLGVLEGLHKRWVTLLRSLGAADFARALHHPENGRMTVDLILALYSWHCRHHTAHITTARTLHGW